MAVDPIRGAGDPQQRVVGTQTAELFEEHGRMVYGLCRALLRDPDDADDATQSTFVSAYQSLLGGSDVREPAAWLATIARNECAARAHARMREPLPLIDADLGHTRGPDEELERKAVVEELQTAIAELPEKQREAVVLRDLYGLQYTEVSKALGISVASVESLLFRARRSLRVSLKRLATGALVVPIAVREGIAQALPGFTTSGAAGGGAASGAVGLGLFAKFTGGPVALKIAASVVAVTATGSVAVVGAEQAGKPRRPAAISPAALVATSAPASASGGSLASAGASAVHSSRHGSGGDDGGGTGDTAGPGGSDGSDSDRASGSQGGSGRGEESSGSGSEAEGSEHHRSGESGSGDDGQGTDGDREGKAPARAHSPSGKTGDDSDDRSDHERAGSGGTDTSEDDNELLALDGSTSESGDTLARSAESNESHVDGSGSATDGSDSEDSGTSSDGSGSDEPSGSGEN